MAMSPASIADAPSRRSRTLVDGLSGRLSPGEAVLRTLQHDEPDAVIGGVAARRAGDDHLVAGLQRSARDAGASELAGAAPLHVIGDHRAVLLLHIHVHE